MEPSQSSCQTVVFQILIDLFTEIIKIASPASRVRPTLYNAVLAAQSHVAPAATFHGAALDAQPGLAGAVALLLEHPHELVEAAGPPARGRPSRR